MIYVMKNITNRTILLLSGSVKPGEVVTVHTEQGKNRLAEAGFSCIDIIDTQKTGAASSLQQIDRYHGNEPAQPKTKQRPSRSHQAKETTATSHSPLNEEE